MEIQLTFRYSENDYARAFRAHHASSLHLWKDAIFVALATAAGVYVWKEMHLRWQGALFIAAATLLVMARVMLAFITPRWAFRREPKFRDEYSMLFSPEGIHFRTKHIDSRLEWKMYTRVLETDHSYLLYYGPSQFTVIPKRIFESDERRLEFEKMLSQYVPK